VPEPKGLIPAAGGSRVLLSFDIDGTLAAGDPPGPLSMDVVRLAKALGYRVGSASDHTVAFQRRMWALHQIDVDFVGHKHHLPDIRRRFSCQRHVHIGDTDLDRHYAELAGMEFYFVDQIPDSGGRDWIF
jgi:hypothetical protein